MRTALGHATAVTVPDVRAVMKRAGGENFPVASRVLARRDRSRLLALYGFARLADELGDSFEGDRLSALGWLEQELDRAYEGRARHPVLVALGVALSEQPLPRAPFLRLIEANRVDQRVNRYDSWSQLLAYCELSANPVGELVLHVFDLASPANIELSDRICSALQLTEHWQDVREDLLRGRIYLPAEDLERFSLAPEDLARMLNSPSEGQLRRLREAIAFEVRRTRELLDSGAELPGAARGRRKLALAAFVAGGRAALDAIGRAGNEVFVQAPPKASRTRRVGALAGVLAGALAGSFGR